MPSSREIVLPSQHASGSGEGLQISLDLEEVHEANDEDEWEDVDHLKTSGSQEKDKVRWMLLADLQYPKSCPTFFCILLTTPASLQID